MKGRSLIGRLTTLSFDRGLEWVYDPMLHLCPVHRELSKWRQAAVWATPASHLLAPPTAAVLTNGSDTPVSVNPVSVKTNDDVVYKN